MNPDMPAMVSSAGLLGGIEPTLEGGTADELASANRDAWQRAGVANSAIDQIADVRFGATQDAGDIGQCEQVRHAAQGFSVM